MAAAVVSVRVAKESQPGTFHLLAQHTELHLEIDAHNGHFSLLLSAQRERSVLLHAPVASCMWACSETKCMAVPRDRSEAHVFEPTDQTGHARLVDALESSGAAVERPQWQRCGLEEEVERALASPGFGEYVRAVDAVLRDRDIVLLSPTAPLL